MSAHSLSSGCEAVIQIMAVNNTTRETVRSCILKYTLPDTFCKKLSWVIYRIEQAIKGIFGTSDWTATRSTIQSQLIQEALSKEIISLNPKHSSEKKLNEGIVKYFSTVAEEQLSIAFVLQQEKAKNSVELGNRLDRLNSIFENALQRFKKIRSLLVIPQTCS